ncbi:nicotianamine synthase 3 [Pyricularia oryzae 70-15]|uniref:Nicotianamine synthase 3 n=1 Tax=Pyricularia oryzae (strain 70-15 / ATCC MYA-4617 / FGSC 8958) TaxID=242507 RepID=G4NG29_PYRO7|nr:nicotianamine synthase 3 [Pyricularia oryzae 70-15]EHA46986.1 nicotianamine synthase 3 [Pyricularia oryzae 70-15]
MAFLRNLVQTFRDERSRRDKARAIATEILNTYDELQALNSLEPGPKVNELLTNLVGLCASSQDERVVNMTIQVLGSKPLRRVLLELRDMCSTAEFHLESHWSKRIHSREEACDSGVWEPDAWDRLRAFPYFGNYEELVRIELAAIYTVLHAPPAKIAYIGSGPLPLTSFCLLQALTEGPNPWGTSSPTEILNIDRSLDAVATSKALAQDLGLVEKGMQFTASDADDEALDLRGFPVVCLAALVGSTQSEKEGLLCSIASRMDAGAILVTRSAWGLRKCLYPELHITDRLLEHLEVCLVLHPHGHVINSVVVFRVKPGPKAG